MLATETEAQLRLLAVCALVLYIKFLLTTTIQGRRAFHAGTRLPEDATLPMAKGTAMATANTPEAAATLRLSTESQNPALERELRWRRIVQNDLESMPLAIAVFLTSILAGGRARVNRFALVVYTIARVLHTVCYATKRAIPRMVVWMIGILCILVAGMNGAITAIQY